VGKKNVQHFSPLCVSPDLRGRGLGVCISPFDRFRATAGLGGEGLESIRAMVGRWTPYSSYTLGVSLLRSSRKRRLGKGVRVGVGVSASSAASGGTNGNI